MKIIKFHPSSSNPVQQALDSFGPLLEPVKASLELIASGSTSETFVVEVGNDLWCITLGEKGYWAFLFYTELPGGVIVCLNGYSKKSKRMPAPSSNQIRRAKYLAKELQNV